MLVPLRLFVSRPVRRSCCFPRRGVCRVARRERAVGARRAERSRGEDESDGEKGRSVPKMREREREGERETGR